MLWMRLDSHNMLNILPYNIHCIYSTPHGWCDDETVLVVEQLATESMASNNLQRRRRRRRKVCDDVILTHTHTHKVCRQNHQLYMALCWSYNIKCAVLLKCIMHLLHTCSRRTRWVRFCAVRMKKNSLRRWSFARWQSTLTRWLCYSEMYEFTHVLCVIIHSDFVQSIRLFTRNKCVPLFKNGYGSSTYVQIVRECMIRYVWVALET